MQGQGQLFGPVFSSLFLPIFFLILVIEHWKGNSEQLSPWGRILHPQVLRNPLKAEACVPLREFGASVVKFADGLC